MPNRDAWPARASRPTARVVGQAGTDLVGVGRPRASRWSALSIAQPGGPTLSGYLARPNFSAASGSGRHGVVLSHGFPELQQRAGTPELRVPAAGHTPGGRDGRRRADLRLPGHGCFGGRFLARRLAGRPGGRDRDLAGGPWDRENLARRLRRRRDAVHLCGRPKTPPWPAWLRWLRRPSSPSRGGDPRRLVAQARAAGVIRTRGYPPDPSAWARELRQVRPTQLVTKVPPRPVADRGMVPVTTSCR